jgi:4-hydroxythreonine-4-phosphate dehydrogenase
METDKPLVGITMGDPSGIGPEVIVSAYPDLIGAASIVVIGDADVMERAVDICEANLAVRTIDEPASVRGDAGTIDVIDLDNVDDFEYGVVKEEYGEASLEFVKRAIRLALDGGIDAIATAPIHKQSTKLAGSTYAGHTGMLADYTDTQNYSMMLIEQSLRVTHVSTHVPLREACDLVTAESVYETIEVTAAALEDLGIDEPTIAVAGLNPHASDGGLLGDEDAAEIEPAIVRARDDGIDVFGPESPDTVYVSAAGGAADCVVSMYHDQGHIPIKMLGFSDGASVSGVNMTIGLPIIRTSVDHGTAFDIAGEGIASPTSMVDAVELAAQVASNGA